MCCSVTGGGRRGFQKLGHDDLAAEAAACSGAGGLGGSAQEGAPVIPSCLHETRGEGHLSCQDKCHTRTFGCDTPGGFTISGLSTAARFPRGSAGTGGQGRRQAALFFDRRYEL